MKRRLWSPAEVELLRRNYADSRTDDLARVLDRPSYSVSNKAYALGLHKSAAFLESKDSGRLDGSRDNGMRFAKGLTPWNKGTTGVVGVQEGCRATQFKKGQSPHNTQPIGSFRLNKEGHLQQKISNASGSNSMRWRTVAELVWCAANGPLPPKHMVVFRPGLFSNKLEEITLGRIECISMAENARRNHPRMRDPELAKLVQLKGAITRQVNRIVREAKERQS
ncbi:HNH endonuclease [Ralstonia sp. TCR112]|uniref:HNH endonuclease n=1 Tax=Ralstonia sp. TCR112 TaxID=2601730 RepID=UPI0011BFAA42|nr:HNH endonuclease [Ralstonia sp. TCR112]TXD58842.1 HNH endonuclease [Ralstonia sp. TCR112]